MVGLQVGWALSVLGSEPCTGVAGRGAVLRTTDGGLDWSIVSPPATAQERLLRLEALSALQAVVVAAAPWSTGPASVDVTSNGGSSWTSSVLAGRLPAGTPVSVDFVGHDGWIMMVSDAAMGEQEAMVYRSSDSGATWHVVESTLWTGPPVGRTIALGGLKDGLVFQNGQGGWAGATNNGSGLPELFSSTDGGATWAPQVLAVPAGVPGGGTATVLPTFFSPTSGALPVFFGYGHAEEMAVYTTQDGGTTWTAGPLLGMPGAGLTPPVATAAGGDMWVADLSTLDFSSDRGQTWTAITPGAPFGSVRTLDFVDRNRGWALERRGSGGDALAITNDGGHTWTTLAPLVTAPRPAA